MLEALWNFSLSVSTKIGPTEAEVYRKWPSDFNGSFTFGKQNHDFVLARLLIYLISHS